MLASLNRQRLTENLRRVAQGDRTALSKVYRDTSAKLLGVCLRILSDHGEAEDVLQDVYLTVWRNAGLFEAARGSPITWLAAIARNKAIDRVRAGATRRSEPIDRALDIPDPAPAALDGLATSDERRRLDLCLGELDPEHEQTIRTAFLTGLTYEEVAAQSGVPLGTVKSRIRRGLLKLRICLER